MRIPARATLGVASVASLLAAATCAGGGSETAIEVAGVTPNQAYNNNKVNLVIHGGPFRPAYDIDTDDGRAATQLGAFTAYLSSSGGGQRIAFDSLTWLSTSALAAELRADIPGGTYDVEVLDPRGVAAELLEGFVSLGSDDIDPKVKILEPEGGTVVNPGAEVPVAFWAKDTPGRLEELRWTVSSPGIPLVSDTCKPLESTPTEIICRFAFVVPPQLKSSALLNLNIDVFDEARNKGSDVTTLTVGVAPVIKSFTPHEATTRGGREFSLEGANFVTGTKVLIGGVPIEPGGGTVVDDTHIVGMTPAHDPGVFPVVVRSGGISVEARDPFTFVGAPQVLAVSPSSGAPAGGTPVVIVGKGFREETRIRFGSEFGTAPELLCPTLVSPNRIQGYAPPGVGAVSVWAFDPVSGTDERMLAFTYLSEDSPDASLPGPTCPEGDGGVP